MASFLLNGESACRQATANNTLLDCLASRLGLLVKTILRCIKGVGGNIMKSRIAGLLAAGVLLAGCTQYAGSVSGGVSAISMPVEVSVARKALGENAISVDPFVGNDITIPGIYNISKNQSGRISFTQICENDTSLQTAIKEMRSKITDNSEILEDSLYPIKIKVNVLGVNLSQPYMKIKVSGYKIKRVYSGDSDSPENWILSNVAADCRDNVLPNNKPYIVVTSVATADNIETVAGGGVSEMNFGIGVADFQIDPIAPSAEGRRQNRVFAIEGRVVEKSARPSESNAMSR